MLAFWELLALWSEKKGNGLRPRSGREDRSRGEVAGLATCGVDMGARGRWSVEGLRMAEVRVLDVARRVTERRTARRRMLFATLVDRLATREMLVLRLVVEERHRGRNNLHPLEHRHRLEALEADRPRLGSSTHPEVSRGSQHRL